MDKNKVISETEALRLKRLAKLIPENDTFGDRRTEPYTVARFKQDLLDGEFAWPGGYPTYFLLSDGEALSYDAARDNEDQIVDSIASKDDNSGWRVIGKEVNWEDADLYCSDTGDRIPSAYAEPDELEPVEDGDEALDDIDEVSFVKDKDYPEDFESHLTAHDEFNVEPEKGLDDMDSDEYMSHAAGKRSRKHYTGYNEGRKVVKLSSLSEDLRKEVKKHLKEGKAKLSQMPEGVRRRLMKESEEMSQMMNSEEAYQQAGEKCSDARRKGDSARAQKQQAWFNRAIAMEKGINKEKAQAAFDRGYGSSKGVTPTYLKEDEHPDGDNIVGMRLSHKQANDITEALELSLKIAQKASVFSSDGNKNDCINTIKSGIKAIEGAQEIREPSTLSTAKSREVEPDWEMDAIRNQEMDDHNDEPIGEAEHSLKNGSKIHAQAKDKVNSMPNDSGFGGGPKEYKMNILKAMDPKKMSQSDIETCQDIIDGH